MSRTMRNPVTRQCERFVCPPKGFLPWKVQMEQEWEHTSKLLQGLSYYPSNFCHERCTRNKNGSTGWQRILRCNLNRGKRVKKERDGKPNKPTSADAMAASTPQRHLKYRPRTFGAPRARQPSPGWASPAAPATAEPSPTRPSYQLPPSGPGSTSPLLANPRRKKPKIKKPSTLTGAPSNPKSTHFNQSPPLFASRRKRPTTSSPSSHLWLRSWKFLEVT